MKTFVVLGMHRTASSLIAKGLAGEIDMGARFEYREDNPKGHWENWAFVSLNEEILNSAGGSWDSPPSRKSILEAGKEFKPRIEELVNLFNKRQENWGWKDPRTALTIELYVPYLINPHYICIFRDSLAVAESLQRRDGFTIEKGISLTEEYNKRIIDFLITN